MYFYTFQNKDFDLNSDIIKVPEEYEEPIFKKAYLWLKHQYNQRNENKIDHNDSFIWFWNFIDQETLDRELTYNKKYCHNNNKLIILDVPEKDLHYFLKSDFEAWHMVLNEWHIQNWEDIFNYQRLIDTGWYNESDPEVAQYTTPFIKKEWIIKTFNVKDVTENILVNYGFQKIHC